MAGKRLAVFIDGTWRNVEANTNVWRLRSLVAERGGGKEQRVYYHAGVGTAPGERFWGGAFGYGVSGQIISAYRWLIEHYDTDDEIFIFGFSRGAYLARSLAGLIATCGLLRPGAPLSVEQVFDRYSLNDEARPIWKLEYERERGGELTRAEQRLLDYSCRVQIKMLGVWDTVGSLGIPFGNLTKVSRRKLTFHNTHLSQIYSDAYQALAVDEHRPDFAPTLWTRFIPTRPDPEPALVPSLGDVEQRWFVGCHSNVGGGYRDDDLSQRPLAWLKDKAEALGLAFRFPVPLNGTEHLGPIVDAYSDFLRGYYRVLKFGRRFRRVIGAAPREVPGGLSETVNETIDGSVFDRWRTDPSYRPWGVEEWAARRQIDPADITGTVEAATLRPVPPSSLGL